MDKTKKCIAGCRIYSGHERYHHKDCPFYPESFSKRFDLLQSSNTALQEESKRFRNLIADNEIILKSANIDVRRMKKYVKEIKKEKEKIEKIAHKVLLCFPQTIPKDQEEQQFNIPAYIIDELYEVLQGGE